MIGQIIDVLLAERVAIVKDGTQRVVTRKQAERMIREENCQVLHKRATLKANIAVTLGSLYCAFVIFLITIPARDLQLAPFDWQVILGVFGMVYVAVGFGLILIHVTSPLRPLFRWLALWPIVLLLASIVFTLGLLIVSVN